MYMNQTHTKQLKQLLKGGVRTELLSKQPHSGVVEVVEGGNTAQCEWPDCLPILKTKK